MKAFNILLFCFFSLVAMNSQIMEIEPNDDLLNNDNPIIDENGYYGNVHYDTLDVDIWKFEELSHGELIIAIDDLPTGCAYSIIRLYESDFPDLLGNIIADLEGYIWPDNSLHVELDPDKYYFLYSKTYEYFDPECDLYWIGWHISGNVFGTGCCCSSSYSNTTDDWITHVVLNTIDNYSGQEGSNSYGDYRHISTTLIPGQTYLLCVEVYIDDNYTQHVWAFIDWNQDCEIDNDFDFNERYDLGTVTGQTGGSIESICMDITVPTGLEECDRCLRVIEQWDIYPEPPEPCDPHPTDRGETEDYTVHIGDNPCPVTLSGFTGASVQGEYASLTWSCESESDMLGYMVYRSETSLENADFISQVIAAENLSYLHEYSYEDHEIEYEKTYNYWLEGISFDGITETWGPVTLTIEQEDPDELPEKTILIGNYPNPFKPVTNIKFNIRKESKAVLTIVNTKGQVVERAEFDAGYHNFEWNAENISSGVYFYKLESENYNETKKMILLK